MTTIQYETAAETLTVEIEDGWYYWHAQAKDCHCGQCFADGSTQDEEELEAVVTRFKVFGLVD